MRLVKNKAARERLMKIIHDDVHRMDRLITDISNASRLDSELATDKMVSIDLVKMLQNLVDYQSELAEADGVSIIANFDETTPNILGLESRLAQVFVNLITNAISFVPKGGSVTVSAFPYERDEVAIVIEDTGCGIPKESLEDVFERFYSSRPEQDFGNNSGLGLSISKQIVEAHGGEIWAENIYGDDPNTPTGARFTVLLPV